MIMIQVVLFLALICSGFSAPANVWDPLGRLNSQTADFAKTGVDLVSNQGQQLIDGVQTASEQTSAAASNTWNQITSSADNLNSQIQSGAAGAVNGLADMVEGTNNGTKTGGLTGGVSGLALVAGQKIDEVWTIPSL